MGAPSRPSIRFWRQLFPNVGIERTIGRVSEQAVEVALEGAKLRPRYGVSNR